MDDRRRTLLDRMRAEQARENSRLTPQERFDRARELGAFGAELHRAGGGAAPVGVDEPPELWLRILARRREVASSKQ